MEGESLTILRCGRRRNFHDAKGRPTRDTGRRELRTPGPQERLYQGTLLSREHYLIDVQEWGFADARYSSASTMTADDVVLWTVAIDDKS